MYYSYFKDFAFNDVVYIDDFSHVKLQPVEGMESADYINVSYIDVRVESPLSLQCHIFIIIFT